MIKYNFRNYLLELAKKQVKDTKYFVIGNTSVDYDSFFGSILFAYLLSNLTQRFYIPIINCLKQEIKLRFQIMFVLQKLLINKDIFHYSQYLTEERMKQDTFNLVDHNYRSNIKNIQYITDHHTIKQIKARKYLIHNLGSNLTNLYFLFYPSKVEYINNQQYVQKFNKFIEKQPFNIPKQFQNKDLMIDQIIRYGILVDSFNFDINQASRWSSLDKLAVQMIQKNQNYDIGYKQLDQIKFDQKRYKKLNFNETLVKDFKRQTYNSKLKPIVIDYSIIYISPTQYMQQYQDEMQKNFTKTNQQANIYIIMAIFKGNEGKFQREMIIRFRDNDENQRIKFLEIVKNMGNVALGYIRQWCWLKNPSCKLSRKLFDAYLIQNLSNL